MKKRMNKLNLPESECSCKECVSFCEYRPCWGTPEEMQKIIDAGYGHRLMLDYWVRTEQGDIYNLCGAIKGYEGKSAPSFVPLGECTFLTADKKCELHEAGLKPLEGRIANHNGDVLEDTHKKVAFTWNNRKAQKIVDKWIEEYQV